MDWYTAFSLLAGAVGLTAATVAISHILRRTDWLPSWLAWYWFRKSENSRRQGWGLLVFLSTALPVAAMSWWPDALDALALTSLVLILGSAALMGWPHRPRQDTAKPRPSGQPPPVH